MVILSLLVLAGLLAGPAQAATPSFDCAKADGAAQDLICGDDQLAALDRELTRLFDLARDGRSMTAERRRELVAYQRGWIKGRDDCWKADDLRRCVYDAYLIRIHELRQGYADARSHDAQGISVGPLVADCEDFDAAIGLTFVNIDPSALVLQWRQEIRVLTQTRAASGVRYAATSGAGETVFWEKGNQATFELPGEKTRTCTIEQPG